MVPSAARRRGAVFFKDAALFLHLYAASPFFYPALPAALTDGRQPAPSGAIISKFITFTVKAQRILPKYVFQLFRKRAANCGAFAALRQRTLKFFIFLPFFTLVFAWACDN